MGRRWRRERGSAVGESRDGEELARYPAFGADDIERQVRESVARGARVLTGGPRIGKTGCFYAPTVLIDVRSGMPVYDEETFGPVAAVIRVADEDEAVRVANDTPYGLGASVWTRDSGYGRELAAAGIREFTNLRTYWLSRSAASSPSAALTE